MQSSNAISISSIKDIIDNVPEENMESFLKDLHKWVLVCRKVRDFNIPWGRLKMFDENTMQRVNDWENYVNVNIDVKTVS